MNQLSERAYWIGPEYVSGIVIGGYENPYQFWTKDEPGEQRKIAEEHFESDEEAMAWFKKKHPDWFKRGVEMRVYDGSAEAYSQGERRRANNW